MKLIKVKNNISVAGGNMGSCSRKYVSGINEYYQYNEDIVIVKHIPRTDLKQDKSIIFSAIINEEKYFISNDLLNEDLLNKIYSNCLNEEILYIKSTDISRAEKTIEKYEKLFLLLKDTPFIDVVSDFLPKSIFTKNVKAKLLINRGNTFTSFKQINNL